MANRNWFDFADPSDPKRHADGRFAPKFGAGKQAPRSPQEAPVPLGQSDALPNYPDGGFKRGPGKLATRLGYSAAVAGWALGSAGIASAVGGGVGGILAVYAAAAVPLYYATRFFKGRAESEGFREQIDQEKAYVPELDPMLDEHGFALGRFQKLDLIAGKTVAVDPDENLHGAENLAIRDGRLLWW